MRETSTQMSRKEQIRSTVDLCGFLAPGKGAPRYEAHEQLLRRHAEETGTWEIPGDHYTAVIPRDPRQTITFTPRRKAA